MVVLTVGKDSVVQAVAVNGGCSKKKEQEENLQGQRIVSCCGWTVAVLASCGVDDGWKADDDDIGCPNGGERESVNRHTAEKEKI